MQRLIHWQETISKNETHLIIFQAKNLVNIFKHYIEENYGDDLNANPHRSWWDSLINNPQDEKRIQEIQKIYALCETNLPSIGAVQKWLHSFVFQLQNFIRSLTKEEKKHFNEIDLAKKINSLKYLIHRVHEKRLNAVNLISKLYRHQIAQIKEELQFAESNHYYSNFHQSKISNLFSQIGALNNDKILKGKIEILPKDIENLLLTIGNDHAPFRAKVRKKLLRKISQSELNDLYLTIYNLQISNLLINHFYEELSEVSNKQAVKTHEKEETHFYGELSEVSNKQAAKTQEKEETHFFSTKDFQKSSAKAQIRYLQKLLHDQDLIRLKILTTDETILDDIKNLPPQEKLKYLMCYHVIHQFCSELFFEEKALFAKFYFTDKSKLTSVLAEIARKKITWYEDCYYEKSSCEDPFGTSAFKEQLLEALSLSVIEEKKIDLNELIKSIDHEFHRYINGKKPQYKYHQQKDEFYKYIFLQSWQTRMKQLQDLLVARIHFSLTVCAQNNIIDNNPLDKDLLEIKKRIEKLFLLKRQDHFSLFKASASEPKLSVNQPQLLRERKTMR